MRRLTIVVAVIFLAAALVPAAPTKSPGWLLYAQGTTWADRGEYGKALQCFKDAILEAGVMPEADAAIAGIYRAEGEATLAERHYERAYNLRNALGTPSLAYTILQSWAGLYEDQEQYGKMEAKLLQIVADDRWYKGEQLAFQVERNFVEKGLDHVLALYRFDSGFATAAHSKLGWFYHRTGRYPQAIRHLLYAVVLQASEVAGFLKSRDAEAVVTGLAGLLEAVAGERDLRAWQADASLPQDLYYLAATAWELGHPLRARDIWTKLSKTEAAGRYAELSRRQLAAPFREPFLTSSSTSP